MSRYSVYDPMFSDENGVGVFELVSPFWIAVARRLDQHTQRVHVLIRSSLAWSPLAESQAQHDAART
ncbi:MAG: hypothetical protein RMI91_08115 [Gemmatales bacterium]|nr:hypothetical protein [Gemmatales bacterium]MDW7994606.1 hypothetical protein [Gemmatales bacterium]